MKKFLAISVLALCSVAAFAQAPMNPNNTSNGCIDTRVSNAHRTYINSCKFKVNVKLAYTDGYVIERIIPTNNPAEDTRMGDVRWFACRDPFHAFGASMNGVSLPIDKDTTAYQCRLK